MVKSRLHVVLVALAKGLALLALLYKYVWGGRVNQEKIGW